MNQSPSIWLGIHRNSKESVSRNEAIRCIEDAMTGYCGVFRSGGSRPEFIHQPYTYCPRLTAEDVDALEDSLKQAIYNLRIAVEEDKDLKERIPSDPRTRDRCPCCTDDGSEGAKDWKSGHCTECCKAGCPQKGECVRPAARASFYNPGVDAPHGWGLW